MLLFYIFRFAKQVALEGKAVFDRTKLLPMTAAADEMRSKFSLAPTHGHCIHCCCYRFCLKDSIMLIDVRLFTTSSRCWRRQNARDKTPTMQSLIINLLNQLEDTAEKFEK